MSLSSDDDMWLSFTSSTKNGLPMESPPRETNQSSSLLDLTKQLIQIIRENKGNCDLNKAMEKLHVRERIYDVYNVLLGAGIIEKPKDDKRILLKLRANAPALPPPKSDKEIQTGKTRMCAFINLSLDNKVKTINCFHCKEEFPIWNWPKFSTHVKEIHLGWDLELLEVDETKATAESVPKENTNYAADNSKKAEAALVKAGKVYAQSKPKTTAQKPTATISHKTTHPVPSHARVMMPTRPHVSTQTQVKTTTKSSQKLIDPSHALATMPTRAHRSTQTQVETKSTKKRLGPSHARATMPRAHASSQTQVKTTTKSSQNLIGYVTTNDHAKPAELFVQSVDDLIELVLDDAEDLTDVSDTVAPYFSYAATKTPTLIQPSMASAYVIPAYSLPSYASDFVSSVIGDNALTSDSIAPTFVSSINATPPKPIVNPIEFVSSGQLDENELVITYTEYSDDDGPAQYPDLPASICHTDDECTVIKETTPEKLTAAEDCSAVMSVREVESPMDFEPLSDVESLESLKFEFPVKPLIPFRPIQILDVDSPTAAEVVKPKVSVVQKNTSPKVIYEVIYSSDSEIETLNATNPKEKTQKTAETKSTQIFFRRTDPKIVMDFLDMFQMRPMLWNSNHASMKLYNAAVAEITALLNAKWNQYFTQTSTCMSLKRIRDWYCNVLYNRSKHKHPDDYQHKFHEYFNKCAEFLPKNSLGLPCNQCSLRLHNEISLQLHKYRKHGVGNLPYICNYCDARFGDTGNLERHELAHLKPRKKCRRCNEEFDSENSLQQHVKTHSLTCKCDICDKEFTTKAICRQHRIKHFEPKYKCELCPKRFVLRARLIHHMKIHRHQYDFICEYCGKAFIRKSYMEEHQKGIHHLEIICKICDKPFGNNTCLWNHQKRHHFVYEGTIEDLEQITATGYKKMHCVRDAVTKERFYKCDVCDNHYKTKNALHKHRAKIHDKRRIKHPNFHGGGKKWKTNRKSKKTELASKGNDNVDESTAQAVAADASEETTVAAVEETTIPAVQAEVGIIEIMKLSPNEIFDRIMNESI